jgi:t-SNARE complex subunit (syntaxin)
MHNEDTQSFYSIEIMDTIDVSDVIVDTMSGITLVESDVTSAKVLCKYMLFCIGFLSVVCIVIILLIIYTS